MQFVSHGPDIPEILLDAHEEGRVVFFCGAGISRPAGLPGFEGLVEQIYKDIGTHWERAEEESFKRTQFDATLDLLERRIVGQRERVRTALAKVLKPKFRKKGATDIHSALLELSRGRDGSTRLVTTNFDRIFHRLMKARKATASSYVAPFLPVPKDSRWNGVVYLHGLLPETEDQSALNRLVLTSGDFGLAYLVERWAARFVSELFRNYIICFVGYSISDPVLRYMMDALAADRMLGETTPQAYAFGDFSGDEESKKKTEWESKGVIPILYEVQKNDDHSILSRTLQAWSATYRDGVRGRESIVSQYALTRPAGSTKQDDFVGRMLWAISHPSGLPAKCFANFVPAPSLDWLDPLFENRFSHSDLRRFMVSPNEQRDEGLKFSVLCRPAQYTQEPRMALVCAADQTSNWDRLMEQLASWLLRYLNDPALVLSLEKKGGRLHHRFAWLIDRRLDEIYELEKAGKTEELDRLRTESPECIPSSLMRIVWRLLLTGRVKTCSRELDIFKWEGRFNRYGLTTSLRLELRELLSPKVSLGKAFRWGDDLAGKCELKSLIELFRWEVEPAVDSIRHCLEKLSKSLQWLSALPRLLADFEQLLMDALDLTQELCAGENQYDLSYLHLPSISEHWQNRGYHDWVILIELLRDAWIVTMQKDLQKAQQLSRNWISIPHPTFKRLALFAATYDGIVPPEEWVDWLLSDNCNLLWATQTKREVMRLFVLQGRHLSGIKKAQLEKAILTGPPPPISGDDLDSKLHERSFAETVWLCLAKLDSGGLRLGPDALEKLQLLSAANPGWQLDGEQLDEFAVVMSGTGDPNYETQRKIEHAPRQRAQLVNWLRQPKPADIFHEDDWREVCRTRFKSAIYALFVLARENIWPLARWTDALQIWSDEKLVGYSWRRVSQLLRCMSDPDLTSVASSVAFWLEQFSKQGKHEWQSFLELCKRILSLPIATSDDTDRPLIRAINHPVGHVTQSILHQWFLNHPGDGDGLPADIKNVFTGLCSDDVPQNRHGWVILANNVIALFRIDQDWTTNNLLPFFSWDRSRVDAGAAWEAYLYSPRLYRPFIEVCKSDFLATAKNYIKLNECGRQYAAILTYASLDPGDTFTAEELSLAVRDLPEEGLCECAKTLVHAVEGAGDQREQYWNNRIKPYWEKIWPKSLDRVTSEIAEPLARLAIAARDAFPNALQGMIGWLKPFKYVTFTVCELHKAGLCNRFPEDTLKLLNAVIGDECYLHPEMALCLDLIVSANPELKEDGRYIRLCTYAGKHSS